MSLSSWTNCIRNITIYYGKRWTSDSSYHWRGPGRGLAQKVLCIFLYGLFLKRIPFVFFRDGRGGVLHVQCCGFEHSFWDNNRDSQIVELRRSKGQTKGQTDPHRLLLNAFGSDRVSFGISKEIRDTGCSITERQKHFIATTVPTECGTCPQSF